MPNSTRYKYIAIGVNAFVILLSLLILFSLYLFSVVSNSQQQQQSEIIKTEPELSQRFFSSLPLLFQNLINVLGEAATNAGNRNGAQLASSSSELLFLSEESSNQSSWSSRSSPLFSSDRPLITVALLFYLLAIVSCIAIGLEHITLLIILIIIFGFVFAITLTTLVFSVLGSMLEHNLFLFDLWNSLIISVIGLSALQIYTTTFLVYEIFMERRSERSHEYCLAKMVSNEL